MTIENSYPLAVIKRVYGSLEHPDFSFVKAAIMSRPYQSLVQQLQREFEVVEITDENDDVSFRFMLTKSKRKWVVELSMLGRFATILKVSEFGLVRVVGQSCLDQEEQQLVSLLLEDKFEIMDQEELEQRIPLRLWNTEPENVCVYQALFSDTDVLPWSASKI